MPFLLKEMLLLQLTWTEGWKWHHIGGRCIVTFPLHFHNLLCQNLVWTQSSIYSTHNLKEIPNRVDRGPERTIKGTICNIIVLKGISTTLSQYPTHANSCIIHRILTEIQINQLVLFKYDNQEGTTALCIKLTSMSKPKKIEEMYL